MVPTDARASKEKPVAAAQPGKQNSEGWCRLFPAEVLQEGHTQKWQPQAVEGTAGKSLVAKVGRREIRELHGMVRVHGRPTSKGPCDLGLYTALNSQGPPLEA